MAKDQDKINELNDKLDVLLKRQAQFLREIDTLRSEISAFEEKAPTTPDRPQRSFGISQEIPEPSPPAQPVKVRKEPMVKKASPLTADVEKFIGENLINKIGIAITVLGVGIGAKYAIDNELISPLTRIILGYLTGLGLLAFAIKLKGKYENFSAVLLSGAMAILYFITFAAYAFYELFPQPVAFVLMVVFTAFTVLSAIKYNKSVIAHIGLVGAYAVPFLLSEGSGQVGILFSYMTIINIGILIVAFKKYWKSLYYAAFILTWLIYFSWYVFSYEVTAHFGLSLIFLTIYFAIFYLTFLSYKLIKKEKYDKGDIVMLLFNSFIYYGLGYAILESHETGGQLTGLFTLVNAIVHFAVSLVIYRNQQADKNLFYLATGLVLTFLTIAIPVQLDGNWVTLLWVGEATVLFWIGRTKRVLVYEKLSYPLMLLAFFSILHDWSANYDSYVIGQLETSITPLLNVHFLSSMLFISAFALITFLNKRTEPASLQGGKTTLHKIMQFCIPAILLITLYKTFQVEIATYWDQQITDSKIVGDYSQHNFSLLHFKTIWTLNYSMFFLAALSFINLRKLKNHTLAAINLGLNIFVLIIFLTQGLLVLSELREIYMDPAIAANIFHIAIRYVTFAFAGLLMVAGYQSVRKEFPIPDVKVAFDYIFHITLLWVISSELINVMDLLGYTESFKLGLSILWGGYALALIIIGINGNKKHLRIGAILLFSITLVKLFFYDIAALDTIAKTIVFVSLGILLLIISFLYNKYKHIISNELEK